MARTFVGAALAVVLFQPVLAQETLSSSDQRQLDLFDRNYPRVAKDSASKSSYNGIKSAIRMDLDYPLQQVSEAGQRTVAWKERKAKAEQLLSDAAERLGIARPKPAAPSPSAEEEAVLERIDGLMNDRTLWSTNQPQLRRLGKARAERTLAEVEALVERLRPEVATHSHVTHRTQHLPRMRQDLQQAFAAEAFDRPRPGPTAGDQPVPEDASAALEAYRAYRSEHLAELEGAALGQDELSLRISWTWLRELQRELGRRAGQATCLEVREAEWEVERLRHGLDVAFGRPDDFPGTAQREQDRFSSIQRELRERIWPDRVDPLRWQDAAQLQAMQQTLSRYRVELDGLEARFRRTPAYAEAVCQYRAAVARLDREVEESLAHAAEAGDVDAQLASYQETFPREGFDPSFKGQETAAEVRRWGAQLRNWREGVARARAFFELAMTRSVKAKTKPFQDYAAWFQAQVPGAIEAAARARTAAWEQTLKKGLETAQHQFDSGSTEDFKQKLLQQLEDGVRAGQLLAAFRLGYEGTADRAADAERTQSMVAARERLVAQAASILEHRVLPEAASRDPDLLAVARDRVAELVGEGNFRGLRITASPWRYDYREISGDYLVTTWWEAFRVDFAARPRSGGDRWFHESFTIQHRLDSLGAPISGWNLAGTEPSLSLEILPKNLGE